MAQEEERVDVVNKDSKDVVDINTLEPTSDASAGSRVKMRRHSHLKSHKHSRCKVRSKHSEGRSSSRRLAPVVGRALVQYQNRCSM